MSRQFLPRLPKPTFSLRRFLIVVALAGPVSAALYNVYLRPYYDRTSFDAIPSQFSLAGMIFADREPVIADVVWRRAPWHSSRDFAFVIVRPGDTGICSGPWYGRPSETGISISGNAVFVNGARFYPREPRCFLVFDPFAQSFREFPLDVRAKSHDDIISSSTWKNEVLPAAEEIMQRQIKAELTSRRPLGLRFP